MRNLLIAQSGGPTAAINATLAGILKTVGLSKKVDKVYGARHGIEGVIKDQLVELNEIIKNMKTIDTLIYTPSSALGTCRLKLKDWKEEEETYRKIIDIFYQYDIKYFIYIGGNDSMDTVDKISEYCRIKNHDFCIIGAPKTIDNDLHLTDHSPGFGSAIKYIATTISEIACDISSYNIPAVTIVEIMGRNAGWLTAGAAISRINGGPGADLIYLCEKEFDKAVFLRDVKEKLAQKKGILIAVSEGIKDGNNSYLSSQMASGETDSFGHQYIAGAARVLEQLVRKEIGCKVRSIELNLMQRSAAHIASETDISESLMLGQKALICALDGETGRMTAIKRISDKPYQVEYISVPVSGVANRERTVPLEWISPDGHDVTEEFITYMKPLIQGETNVKYKNGIPLQIRL